MASGSTAILIDAISLRAVDHDPIMLWSFARHNVEFGGIEQRQVSLLWGFGNKSPDWGGPGAPKASPRNEPADPWPLIAAHCFDL